MKSVSGGFISDLSFVSLAYGLMHVAMETAHGTCDDIGATTRGADYATNKKIDRRIEKLKEELVLFMTAYAKEKERVEVKNRKLFKLAMSHVKDSIQLDYLACWVLYLRFAPNERNKPLDKAFEWVTNSEGQLMAIIDLLGGTKCADKNGEMYILADKIVKEM